MSFLVSPLSKETGKLLKGFKMAIKHTFTSIGGKKKTKILTRKTAIREFCKHCMQSAHEVSKCTSKHCVLWVFRMGKEGQGEIDLH